jgi:lactate dehydrogenase-like 2-hydroxyacid dehydrogenase
VASFVKFAGSCAQGRSGSPAQRWTCSSRNDASRPPTALDNVVLTPHLGASTVEAQQNVAVEIAEAFRPR